MLSSEDREPPLYNRSREGKEDIDMESSASFGNPGSQSTGSMSPLRIYTFSVFVIGILAAITGVIMMLSANAEDGSLVVVAGSSLAVIGFFSSLSEI